MNFRKNKLFIISLLILFPFISTAEDSNFEKVWQYEINYIDDTIGYHKIINNSNNFSVSLHIYSPPNSDIQIFD